MDEYSSGMEPETKAFLKKVISSIFIGVLWLMILSTFGFYFGMAFIYKKIDVFNIVFYIFFLASFLWILRYYYRKWVANL
jgi:hypothetical protein